MRDEGIPVPTSLRSGSVGDSSLYQSRFLAEAEERRHDNGHAMACVSSGLHDQHVSALHLLIEKIHYAFEFAWSLFHKEDQPYLAGSRDNEGRPPLSWLTLTYRPDAKQIRMLAHHIRYE